MNVAKSLRQYSRSLDIMLEVPDGFHDEPEPRAVVVPRPPMVEVVDIESKTEFFDNLVPMRSDLNMRLEEESHTRPGQLEKLSTDDIWVEQAQFVPHYVESSVSTIDEARARAHAALDRAGGEEEVNGCHEIVWTAWGCDDKTTRRHTLCFLLLLFLFIIVLSFLIGLLTGSTPKPVFSAVNKPLDYSEQDGNNQWIGDLPENKPSEELLPRKPRPTNVTAHEATQQATPCQSSITVDKACYVEDEDLIFINFIDCTPKNEDWVGIWKDGEDITNLSEDYYAWAMSCGTKSCHGAPVSMRIAFESYGLGLDTFRAFLIHDTPDGTPYIVEAMSESFVVTDNCNR